MANSESANVSAEVEASAKLMLEKVVEPDVTSGTLAIVVVSEQVMLDPRAVTTSATSAGRVVDPTMKQADWRGTKRGTGLWSVQLLCSWRMYLSEKGVPERAVPTRARVLMRVVECMFALVRLVVG